MTNQFTVFRWEYIIQLLTQETKLELRNCEFDRKMESYVKIGNFPLLNFIGIMKTFRITSS